MDSTTPTFKLITTTTEDTIIVTDSGHSVTSIPNTSTGSMTFPTFPSGSGSGGVATIGTGTSIAYPYTSTLTIGATGTTRPIPYGGVTPEETEEVFTPPKCGKCRTDVSIIQSFVKKDILIMVFTCHGEKRRVDVSLKKFKGDEADAKAYLLEQIDYLFCDEDEWQKLKPKTVKTENADKNAIERWLSN